MDTFANPDAAATALLAAALAVSAAAVAVSAFALAYVAKTIADWRSWTGPRPPAP